MSHAPNYCVKPFVCLAIGLLGWISPLSAVAAEPKDNTAAPTQADIAHDNISASLNSASQWFDNFFSDPRIDAEPAGTLLRLRGSATLTENEGTSYKGKIKLNVVLPNLNNRYHLILSNEADDLKNGSSPATQTAEQLSTKEQATTLGVQYTKHTNRDLIYTNRLSIQYDDGFNPQLLTRLRYPMPVTEKSLLNFTQSFSWEDNDGFGQQNRIDYDYILRENMLLRTTGHGLFSEASHGYEWLAIQQLLTSFSENKAITVGTYLVGETRPQNHVTEYVCFTEYRQSFIKKWLFVELRPEINWQRENNFKMATAFTVTVEARFGE
jgi:hypothetical protein